MTVPLLSQHVVWPVAGKAVVVGVPHTLAVHTPLQHWWFAVQVARFGLQLALLGSAPALRGVTTSSAPPMARSRNSVVVIRFARLSSRAIIGSPCASVTPAWR